MHINTEDVVVPDELEGLQREAFIQARFGPLAAAAWQEPSPVPSGQKSRWVFARLVNGKDGQNPMLLKHHHEADDIAAIGQQSHEDAWLRLYEASAQQDPQLYQQLAITAQCGDEEAMDVVLHVAVGGKGKKPVVLDIYPLSQRTTYSSEGILHLGDHHRLLLRLHRDHFVRDECADIDVSKSRLHTEISEELMPKRGHPKAVKLEYTAGHGFYDFTGKAAMPDCPDCTRGLSAKH